MIIPIGNSRKPGGLSFLQDIAPECRKGPKALQGIRAMDVAIVGVQRFAASWQFKRYTLVKRFLSVSVLKLDHIKLNPTAQMFRRSVENGEWLCAG